MTGMKYTDVIASSAFVFVLGALLSLLVPGAGITLSALGLAFGVFQTLNMNLAVIREAKADGTKLRLGLWAVQYFGCVGLAVAAWGALAWRVLG